MSVLVVDSSVAAKWFFPEEHTDAAGAIVFDGAPYDPITKVTGYTVPTLAQQTATDRANGKISGWRITQLDAGAIKAVELDIFLSSQ